MVSSSSPETRSRATSRTQRLRKCRFCRSQAGGRGGCSTSGGRAPESARRASWTLRTSGELSEMGRRSREDGWWRRNSFLKLPGTPPSLVPPPRAPAGCRTRCGSTSTSSAASATRPCSSLRSRFWCAVPPNYHWRLARGRFQADNLRLDLPQACGICGIACHSQCRENLQPKIANDCKRVALSSDGALAMRPGWLVSQTASMDQVRDALGGSASGSSNSLIPKTSSFGSMNMVNGRSRSSFNLEAAAESTSGAGSRKPRQSDASGAQGKDDGQQGKGRDRGGLYRMHHHWVRRLRPLRPRPCRTLLHRAGCSVPRWAPSVFPLSASVKSQRALSPPRLIPAPRLSGERPGVERGRHGREDHGVRPLRALQAAVQDCTAGERRPSALPRALTRLSLLRRLGSEGVVPST